MPNNIYEELVFAVVEGDLEKVRVLLSAGVNPDFRVDNLHCLAHQRGNYLVHCAKSEEIVKILVLHGASVNSRNRSNETPLHTAISSGQTVNLIRVLLQLGADVNAQDCRDDTPLDFAMTKRNINLEIIKELMEYGADINIKRGIRKIQILNLNDSQRRHLINDCSPLENAMSYTECAELLIKFALLNNSSEDYKNIVNLNPYKRYSSYSELLYYFNSCVTEIVQMKTHNIKDDLSLYEFITKKEANKELSFVNDYIVRSIRNQAFQVPTSADYPIYHDVIWPKIGACLKRARLLGILCKLKVYAVSDVSNHMHDAQEKIVVLDFYSKEEVAQYLPNNDLLNFTEAFDTNKSLHLKDNFTESSTRLPKASTSNYAKRVRLE